MRGAEGHNRGSSSELGLGLRGLGLRHGAHGRAAAGLDGAHGLDVLGGQHGAGGKGFEGGVGEKRQTRSLIPRSSLLLLRHLKC